MSNLSIYKYSERREEAIETKNDQRLLDDRRGHFLNLITPNEEFYNDMINGLLKNGDDQWSIGSN